MLKYIIKRILMLIPVMLGVSVIVFLIMRVFSPDPAPIVLGQHATQVAVEAWRQANGLNDPILLQYFHFITGALTGDLGTSYYTKMPVTKEIFAPVSYTHLRAHETRHDLVCRLLLEKKKK